VIPDLAPFNKQVEKHWSITVTIYRPETLVYR